MVELELLQSRTEVLLDLIPYLENTFSHVSHNKFLKNRGAICILESALKG